MQFRKRWTTRPQWETLKRRHKLKDCSKSKAIPGTSAQRFLDFHSKPLPLTPFSYSAFSAPRCVGHLSSHKGLANCPSQQLCLFIDSSSSSSHLAMDHRSGPQLYDTASPLVPGYIQTGSCFPITQTQEWRACWLGPLFWSEHLLFKMEKQPSGGCYPVFPQLCWENKKTPGTKHGWLGPPQQQEWDLGRVPKKELWASSGRAYMCNTQHLALMYLTFWQLHCITTDFFCNHVCFILCL